MSETESADKPHEPTPTKLAEARRKGELVKSAEVNTAAMYAGFLIVAALFGGASLAALGEVMAPLLARPEALAARVFDGGGQRFAGAVIGAVARALAPWVAVPLVCVLLAILAQRSLVFSGRKLAFKAARLSPVSNFRNKFGWNGLFEFFKSAVKLAIYAAILTGFLRGRSEQIIAAMHLGAVGAIVLWLELAAQLLALVLAIALAIAAGRLPVAISQPQGQTPHVRPGNQG